MKVVDPDVVAMDVIGMKVAARSQDLITSAAIVMIAARFASKNHNHKAKQIYHRRILRSRATNTVPSGGNVLPYDEARLRYIFCPSSTPHYPPP